MITIAQADLWSSAAAPLLRSLQEEHIARYGTVVDEGIRSIRAVEFEPPTGAFLLATADGETIAGGALRRWADGVGEIKRMWTAPAHRRRGHARRILAALEAIAAHSGYRSVRLQTGTLQTEAIALYRAAGYRAVPPSGRCARASRSVDFEKVLARG
jgi:ribosomal protein S18 acetylase RimI-like enzyme